MELDDALFNGSNLTRAQFLIWVGQAIAPDAPVSNTALVFDLGKDIDEQRFQQAFQKFVDQNDAMRLVFDVADGVPMQRVLDKFTATVEVVDLGTEDPNSNTVQTNLVQRATHMFDLSRSCIDCALLRLKNNHYLWFINVHHLANDAQTTGLIYQRVLTAYFELAAEPAPAFMDYLSKEQQLRESPATLKAQQHWRARVESSPPYSDVNFYGRSSSRGSTASVRIPLQLSESHNQQLKALAETEGFRHLTTEMSLFTVFFTLLAAYLHRAGGRNTVAIGAPVHNRVSKSAKETIGLFSEVFPLQVQINPQDTFVGLATKVRVELQSFMVNGCTGSSSAELSASYDTLLNFITTSLPEVGGIVPKAQWLHPGHCDVGHNLRLQVQDFDGTGQYLLCFDLNEEVFPKTLQPVVLEQFSALMEAMLEDSQQAIAEVDIVPESVASAWQDFNAGQIAAIPTTILTHFDAEVVRQPHAVALQQDQKQLRYEALDHRSNQLAYLLSERGVVQGDVVAIALPRSIELVVAVLAILKSGAAYLPIDASYPQQRQTFMLSDSGAKILICEQPPHTTTKGVTPLVLATATQELEQAPTQVPQVMIASTDIAYVVYTSGSTGTPKGVQISHGSLAAYIGWADTAYLYGTPPNEGWAMPLFTSFSFDLTVTSLFLPLCTGGKLVIYPQDDFAGDLAILRVLEDNQVNLIKLTPAHLSLLRELNPSALKIRRMILGGEDLRTELALAVSQQLPQVEIYNEYGPTEATVGCMIHRFDPAHDTEASVPIGRPAKHMRVYVLDPSGQLAPPTAIGEIVLAGAGLAAGYRGRDDLTEERFVSGTQIAEQTLYRTGDLGSLGGDGVLRFHGRADQQLKLRGRRVEPAEIETALLTQEGVNEALVVSCAGIDVAASRSHLCIRCGLPASVPEAQLDSEHVCQLCREFDDNREQVMDYFSDMSGFEKLAHTIRLGAEKLNRKQDCIALLSGGKDSTYTLYQLVEHGLTPLVFSLDNGFISDGAKDNIRRAVNELGLELVMATTPGMNEIFADSLSNFSNVCNGCFKVIYTLATQLAEERGIGYIVTGLSRGQIFDSRLKDLFHHKIFDPDRIDALIVDARKAYHRVDDAVSQLMDTELFDDDAVFDRVQFVDFFRYCNVPLHEIYQFLESKAPWVRPSDTGRSTNCLINDVGIWVHKSERGYHNYAEPYSWDVRLGHKQRDAALAELDDEIDVSRVRSVLGEIGYQKHFTAASERAHLVAYYVGPVELDQAVLKARLVDSLPQHMIPQHYLWLAQMPLTPNGKIDRAALPKPGTGMTGTRAPPVSPRNPTEEILVAIWQELLDQPVVGIYDDYLELGGDSIGSIRIASRAQDRGLRISPRDIFEEQTIANLSRVAKPVELTSSTAEPDTVSAAFAGVKSAELEKIAQLLQRNTAKE